MAKYTLRPEWQQPLLGPNGEVRLTQTGEPLRTAYMRGSRREQQRLREHMLEFCDRFHKMADSLGSWATLAEQLNLPRGRLPVIGTDPRGYTLFDIITDIESQLTGSQKNGQPKDIPLSMIERVNWLTDHISRTWNSGEYGAWRIEWSDPTDIKTMFHPLFERT